MKMHQLLRDASCWTQGTEARDAQGRPCDPASSAAVCWSVQGAWRHCYGTAPQKESIAAWIQLAFAVGHHTEGWNDSRYRTFAEVQGLVTELDV